MTKDELMYKKFRGGGIECFFSSEGKETVLCIEEPKSLGGFDLPLKKMEAAHAAMGRAIEAWRERGD